MNRKEYQEETTETGQTDGVEQEPEEQTALKPYNPRDISIDNKPVILEAVIRRIKQGTMNLAPDFQRKTVWNNIRKSQLIESLMLSIPIPLFYVSQTKEGVWDVVDGLQRLTAIKEFVSDKSLILQGLEFWKEYDGKGIDGLPPLLYNRIMETAFQFVIIGPGTPEAVKYNIFKRINTGGMPLSSQEIRHALYQGKGTRLLEKLSLDADFLTATDNSIDDSRMAAREIILRCLSCMVTGYASYQDYDSMDTYLCRGLRVLNDLEAMDHEKECAIFEDIAFPEMRYHSYETLICTFITGMKRSYLLFEKNAFRISLQKARRAPINKSLFETWGSILPELADADFQKLLQRKEKLYQLFDTYKKNDTFLRAVSRDAWKKTSVFFRFETMQSIIEEVLHDY
jgi:hypothetical protein